MDHLLEFIRSSGLQLFSAEFVSSVQVEHSAQQVSQVDTYLFAADSMEAAQRRAGEMAGSLSERYRNKNGHVVSVECRGVASIDELGSAEYYGALHVSTVRFTEFSRVADLVSEVRVDLPELKQT